MEAKNGPRPATWALRIYFLPLSVALCAVYCRTVLLADHVKLGWHILVARDSRCGVVLIFDLIELANVNELVLDTELTCNIDP